MDLSAATFVSTGAPREIAIGELGVEWANVHHYRLASDPDDTLAFARAAASGKPVLAVGQFFVTALPELPATCPGFRGAGRGATQIVITTTNGAGLRLAPYTDRADVGGFTLTRQGVAAAGGDGIVSQTSIGHARFHDLIIENQYRGLVLCPTDHSVLEAVIAQTNQSDGIALTNTAANGALQWSMANVLATKCGGHGISVTAVSGPSAVALGSWTQVNGFANNGNSVNVAGLPGTPVHGVRITQGFFGSDGASSIKLDTYGSRHNLVAVQVELAGRGYTGPAMATPPTGAGSGFEVTTNNGVINFTGCTSDGASYDGFDLGASLQSLSGCMAFNNGAAVVAGRRNGVRHVAGVANISGGAMTNLPGSSIQQYGVNGYDGQKLVLSGVNLAGNSAADRILAANQSWVTLIGNYPMGLGMIVPAGGVLIGGQATGGMPAPNVINVAGGLLKNGTAYVNP